ncbi:hypothetical protein GC175_03495, partial [bacterium]|nr:hypothetical protein [bacterium]
ASTNVGHWSYGTVRTGSPTALNTDRTYTGQKQDSTGLLYYNARYYDPSIGQFLSPDTLVPDAGLVLDYNRYMYVRGNPLKYSDPSGHYTNDEIMQHFGCSDWACVEANFDGGAYNGLWGWLHMLQMAEDGWLVESTKVVGDNNSFTAYGRFQRDGQGKINILAQGIRSSAGQNHQFSAMLPESDFARYPQGAAIGYYSVRSSGGGYATAMESKRDYLHLAPGMLAVTALKAGTGFGPAIVASSPAAGPAVPVVAGIGVGYTAVGWTTVAIADFVIPISQGDYATPTLSLTVEGVSYVLDRYGGTAGKYTAPALGPMIDIATGACYGTGCPR